MGAPSRSSRSARWDAAAATAPATDRHREADPDEEALTARIGQRGDDAHHLALSVEQWPTGAPGVHRGVELDQATEVSAAALPNCSRRLSSPPPPPRCLAGACPAPPPAVIESARPSGLPTENVSSPT